MFKSISARFLRAWGWHYANKSFTALHLFQPTMQFKDTSEGNAVISLSFPNFGSPAPS